jgi:L-lactate dehydrogenase complex protein LldE
MPEEVPRPRVGLFVTCLVDLFRPTVGFAAIKLIEAAGCDVAVPMSQTCCGQPAYNSGDRRDAQAIARQVIAAFETVDYVVAPSGSCAATLKHHYPQLLAEDDEWCGRAAEFADKVHELISFLVDIREMTTVAAAFSGTVTYHDSCSGLRELGVAQQPRRLLATVDGLTLAEMKEPDVCCGFGGTFCVKYPDISNAIVEKKTADIAATGADTVLAGDLGCLMNISGKLHRQKIPVSARHVAEILADMADKSPIGGTRA